MKIAIFKSYYKKVSFYIRILLIKCKEESKEKSIETSYLRSFVLILINFLLHVNDLNIKTYAYMTFICQYFKF